MIEIIDNPFNECTVTVICDKCGSRLKEGSETE